MVKYKATSITAKTGVNFVRSLVEDAGCLFHKIEQENDLGIDALIELVKDERPLNKQIAAQIRSGPSYYDPVSGECFFPVGSHHDYWSHYPLPVIGVVYVPSLGRAHWVDIKRYLKKATASIIRFKATEVNRLDPSTFRTRFLPMLLSQVPDIAFNEAVTLLQSPHYDESYLGLLVLFRRYPNKTDTWTKLIDYFKVRNIDDIPQVLVYYLAHIPWNGDISYGGEAISSETSEHATTLLQAFGRTEVLKLLAFIDSENMISRGTIGQSVEAIISDLPHIDPILEAIALDDNVERVAREGAALILAMHTGRSAVPTLQKLAASGSNYDAQLVTYINTYGAVNPYL